MGHWPAGREWATSDPEAGDYPKWWKDNRKITAKIAADAAKAGDPLALAFERVAWPWQPGRQIGQRLQPCR
jgi:hypothetical protein